MDNIPSIYDFLSEVDKDGKIDRKQALLDITLVAILSSFKKASAILSLDDQNKIKELLADPKPETIDSIYKIFDSAGKLDELLTISEEETNNLKIDYIKTHLKAMNETQKEEVLKKFPGLREL